MPLSSPKAPRTQKHTRTISIEGFQRDDGLWDLEGTLTDVKTFRHTNVFMDREPGQYHHHMRVRLTIDTKMNVLDAEVASDANPHGEPCSGPAPDYKRLVGLNLARGFRQGVKERMGGASGCTHINELLGVMPTGAYQSFAGTLETLSEDRMKFVFDRCAAWDRGGAIIKQHYPRWYIADRGKQGESPAGSTESA